MPGPDPRAAALARLYDLDLAEDPGDLDLYLALAARVGSPIAELAVGSGRLAVPLAEAGHRVVGIDIDPAMLARARGRRPAAGETAPANARGHLELLEGDILAARPELAGTFRLAILALNSILLFPDPATQARVIGRMAELVASDGLVVVDAWQPQPIDLVNLDGRISLEWLRTDPETGREVIKQASGWYDPATRVVALTTVFEEAEPGGPVTRWTRSERLRLASAEELQRWLEAAGLEVERLAGDYDLGPFGSGSDRAIAIGRKPTARGRSRPE